MAMASAAGVVMEEEPDAGGGTGRRRLSVSADTRQGPRTESSTGALRDQDQ